MPGLSLPFPTLQVTCAIIERQGLALAAQRSETVNHSGKWEFHGGKIIPGESPVEGLRREILEELGLELNIERQLPSHSHRFRP